MSTGRACADTGAGLGHHRRRMKDLPAITLRLHGAATALPASGEPRPLERRAAALCALAALQPRLTREQAARWLWPDSDDPRRNLRQQLLRFRQTLGSPLLSGTVALQLAPGVMLQAAEPGAELLPGEAADDSEFGGWLSQQRHAEAEAHRRPLLQALTDAEAAGELDDALAHAQQLLRLDVHDEAHHTALMRVHYLRGEAAAGLQAGQRLQALLAAGTGAQPSAATQALLQALQAMHGGASGLARVAPPASGRTLPLTLRRPPQLAGRTRERAAIRQAFAEGRAALLLGEAGMGKSRLLADSVADSSACGPVASTGVLQGAGRPGDAGAPYSTLARLLRPLLQPLPAALAREERDALARIAPPGDAEAPASVPTAPQALRPGALQAAVAALLDCAGVHTVVLDDLHFADTATLELVSGLASAEAPRRWLFAQRPAEAPAAALALRDGLHELQRLSCITLEPLDSGAAAQMVDDLGIPGLHGASGLALAGALAVALVRHAGGNPLFMLETLKQGLVDGSLARGELPRPACVGALIERRLQRLSEAALNLARVAAIAGVDFSIELAEAAIGHSAVQLASAWQELQDAQLLRDEALAHDLVADATLRAVPPVVARRVHGQCAVWLAARSVEPARVARHWRLAGRPAEAGRAFVAAALRAEQAARLQEEAALYEQAAQALDEAGLPDERFDALLGRVRSLNQARFDEQAMQACRTLLDGATTDVQRLRAGSELCGLLTERGEAEAALATGESALALARRLGDDEWQLRTACHLASTLCRLGRAEEAVVLLAPLRGWVDQQGDDTLRMLWHGDWGAALGHTGRLTEAVAAFDTALAAARHLGLRDAEGRLLLNCSVTLRQSGQLDRALVLSRQGQALSASASRDAAELPIDALVLARDEAETGHYGRALQVLEPVLAELEKRGTAFWAQACRLVLVRLWLDLGQPARAVPLLRDEAGELPAWLRADRCLLQLELASALDQPAPPGALERVLVLAAADAQRGPMLCVRALRWMPPQQALAQAQELAPLLRGKERFGALLTLHVNLAQAALQAYAGQAAQGTQAAGLGCGAPDALPAAQAAAALLDAGYAPESMYRPEAHRVLWRVLSQAGAPAQAAATLRDATDWIRSRALPEVPAPFLDSFLNRNRINRELLALASTPL